jgi:ketosteroid isomerase-like protein
MSSKDVEIVREVLEARINLDPRLDSTWDGIQDWLHPDFEYREDPSWPGGGTHSGIAAFRAAVSEYFDALEDVRFDPEEFIDTGDRVLVMSTLRARGRSGARVETQQAGIFAVREGRIVSWQVVLDREEALRLLGLQEKSRTA